MKTIVLKLKKEKPEINKLKKVAEILRAGGVVVLPGGAYGNMQSGTTATFGINENNGKLTIRGHWPDACGRCSGRQRKVSS